MACFNRSLSIVGQLGCVLLKDFVHCISLHIIHYHLDYPSTWESEPLEDGKPVTMHMFPVPAGSTEYQDAIKEFTDTIRKQPTIIEVKRIQNRSEYEKHLVFRDTIFRKHNKPVAVKRLFHGSGEDSLKQIAHQGFNRNFAATANGKLG